MNRFNKVSLSKRIQEHINFPLVIAAVILVLFIGAVLSMSESDYFDARSSLEKAIERDIIHCYALEGVYPPSVEYMEENYGLNYNHDRFIVNYERVGSNVMPTYIIIERGTKHE